MVPSQLYSVFQFLFHPNSCFNWHISSAIFNSGYMLKTMGVVHLPHKSRIMSVLLV